MIAEDAMINPVQCGDSESNAMTLQPGGAVTPE
jgi:hypothetical protein